MLLFIVVACRSLDAATGDTGPSATVDTSTPATVDTGEPSPTCSPLAPGPAGATPLVVATELVVVSGLENDFHGKRLFAGDGYAGLAYGSSMPETSSEGVWWWSAQELTAPLTVRPADLRAFQVVQPGDVTGDGVPDLVFFGGITTPEGLRLTVVPGPLPLHLPQVHTDPAVQWFALDLGHLFACGDVNGDGQDDLCGTTGVDFGPVDGILDVSLSLSFDDHHFVADLDGDGRSELYVHDLGTISRVVDPPGFDGGLGPASWSGGVAVLVVDLDGDGADGLLVSVAGALLHVEAADFAAGTHQVLPFTPSAGIRGLGAGDFDGDGVLEIAVGTTAPPGPVGQPHNEVQIFEQDGTLRARIQADPPGEGYDLGHTLVAGDVDGDGVDDLVIGSGSNDYGRAYFVPNPLCAADRPHAGGP